ncbi:MAG: hypothetical protein HY465_03590 [Deltaproteobacteria bacterium]|nr:hypothetical protein [Deltaproteobacteria bacterium]
MRWFVLLLIFFLRITPALAYESIHAIRFEGNVRTPDETMTSTITSHVGSPLNREVIRRDIKALFKLGQFRDIEVEKIATASGVDLIFRCVEHPVVSEIDFTGNRKIKDDDLHSEVTVKTYRPLDEHEVSTSMVKIREAYAKKGYYLAEIDYRTEPIENGDAKLIFEVHEHQGVAVRRVTFMGNRVFDDDELREVLRTKQKGFFSFVNLIKDAQAKTSR